VCRWGEGHRRERKIKTTLFDGLETWYDILAQNESETWNKSRKAGLLGAKLCIGNGKNTSGHETGALPGGSGCRKRVWPGGEP